MMKLLSQVFVILLTLSFAARAQEQIWKAVSGHEIKAEFVEIKDNCVVLKTQEGVVNPPLAALTEESKQLAHKLNAAATKARLAKLTPAIRASTILPENYARPGETLVGAYTSEVFDVHLYTPSCVAYIFIKEDGKYLSEPLQLRLAIRYYDSANVKQPHLWRAVVSLLEKPKFEKNVFEMRALHKDDVESDVRIEVRDGIILAGYKVVDPPKLSLESSPYLDVYSPTAYAVEDSKESTEQIYFNPRVTTAGVSRNELLKTMDGWMLDFKFRDKPKGMQTSFPYGKSVLALPRGTATSIDLSGGVYGPRSVSFSSTGSGAIVYPWFYPGRAPMDGFYVRLRKENHQGPADQASSMLKITIQ